MELQLAKQAKTWKIKMASTFSFINMKLLKVCEKWSGAIKDSIFDIFEVSSNKNDELAAMLY